MKADDGMVSDAVRALDVLAHAVGKLPRGATLQLTITGDDLKRDIQSIWKNRKVQPDGSVSLQDVITCVTGQRVLFLLSKEMMTITAIRKPLFGGLTHAERV